MTDQQRNVQYCPWVWEYCTVTQMRNNQASLLLTLAVLWQIKKNVKSRTERVTAGFVLSSMIDLQRTVQYCPWVWGYYTASRMGNYQASRFSIGDLKFFSSGSVLGWIISPHPSTQVLNSVYLLLMHLYPDSTSGRTVFCVNSRFYCLCWWFFLGFFLPVDCNWQTIET